MASGAVATPSQVRRLLAAASWDDAPQRGGALDPEAQRGEARLDPGAPLDVLQQRVDEAELVDVHDAGQRDAVDAVAQGGEQLLAQVGGLRAAAVQVDAMAGLPQRVDRRDGGVVAARVGVHEIDERGVGECGGVGADPGEAVGVGGDEEQ